MYVASFLTSLLILDAFYLNVIDKPIEFKNAYNPKSFLFRSQISKSLFEISQLETLPYMKVETIYALFCVLPIHIHIALNYCPSQQALQTLSTSCKNTQELLR